VTKPTRQSTTPGDAISVGTYAELDRYICKVIDGSLYVLLLLGRPGTGKTERVRRAILDQCIGNALYVEGHAQPFGIYRALWEHLNQPVILDDLDRLYANPDCVRLLKPLCESKPIKRIAWHTRVTDDDVTLPKEFETRSPVVLIANEWRTINADVQALEDRAIIVHFDPDTAEVHREAGQWCADDVVYEFVGRHLHLVSHVSMRWYAKAARLREAGFVDWQESLLQMMCGNRTMSMVAAVVSDPRLNTENERLAAFQEATGLSRATYFRLKKRLLLEATEPAE
jgi:hypothetical protein